MKKTIATIVGARPQFIKAAVVSHEIANHDDLDEYLIHTGQHFDKNMSQSFFDELEIPHPATNLGIAGGTHAAMTARMLTAIEDLLIESNPAAVLLYGDTNSTLAGALAAAKLHIPIAHVEAGARTYSMTNPEEINRVCTDHVSSRLLASTQGGLENLLSEGIGSRARFVGDPMYDAFLLYRAHAVKPDLESLSGAAKVAMPEEYYYLTCHREENTGREETLSQILSAVNGLDAPVVFPVHPRVKKQVASFLDGRTYPNVMFVEPVGYLESIYLVDHAKQVITDSGGLQREAFFANVKCVTLLDFEVWPETMVDNRNTLAQPTADSIARAIALDQKIDETYKPFGDGNAASRIVEELVLMTEG